MPMQVVTRTQMQQIEQNALLYDMSYQRLMENAGSAAAAFIRRTLVAARRSCVVFCAKGNNGGDGLVVARKLSENGARVQVVLLDGIPQSEAAAAMYNTAAMMEIPILDFATHRKEVEEALAHCDIIVDAICGTGFQGSLRPLHREACIAINDAIAAIVSLDIPTGVECDTGAADKDAVRADFTVVFDSKKPLHILPASIPFCGSLEVVDIGIPPEAREGIAAKIGTLQLEQVLEALPPRPLDCHKGSFGRLLIIAGCSRYRGAAVLCATAALRAGVGLVVLASTEPVCAAAAAGLPEAILCPLPQDDLGYIQAQSAIQLLQEELSKADAVVFGCGLGDTPGTALLLQWMIKNARIPVLLDADGINALSKHIHLLQTAQTPVLLTPHPGEMARLLQMPAKDIHQSRQLHAMRFAVEHRATLVLKGAGTLITDPDGGCYVNTTGNPGLAKGGSGDVLSGIMGGFLAQGIPPEKAAWAGVFLHGMAADRTSARKGQYAMLPSELLEDFAVILMENGR